MAFITVHRNALFLFDRGPFDDILDDYPATYKVFRLGGISLEDAFEPRPEPMRAVRLKDNVLYGSHQQIGEVAVKDVRFDETNRRFFDPVVLDKILSKE